MKKVVKKTIKENTKKVAKKVIKKKVTLKSLDKKVDDSVQFFINTMDIMFKDQANRIEKMFEIQNDRISA